MTTEELIKIGDSLGLEHYNECETHVYFKGINGGASCFYTDANFLPNKNGRAIRITDYTYPAEMDKFARHLKQMGRDSLKMDLNQLLSITSHA